MSNSNLSKSLYQAVMKTLSTKEGKKQSVNQIVSDIKDSNMQAEVPGNAIPAAAQGVLHKDVSVSEAHQMKQANAEAKMGLRPGEQKSPSMGKTAAGAMAVSEEAKEGRGIDKLKKFMDKCEMKKAKTPADKAREASQLKGVHTSGGYTGLEETGRSMAGNEIVSRAPKAGNKYLKEMHHGRGVEMHREKLKELQTMPKPNLPKSEDAQKKRILKRK